MVRSREDLVEGLRVDLVGRAIREGGDERVDVRGDAGVAARDEIRELFDGDAARIITVDVRENSGVRAAVIRVEGRGDAEPILCGGEFG